MKINCQAEQKRQNNVSWRKMENEEDNSAWKTDNLHTF